MPSIKDISTVGAIAREFTSNGRRKGKALQAVGYSDAYSIDGGRGCDVVFSNVRVIAAIAAIDADNQVEMGHNYSIAVQLLRDRLQYLQAQAERGNIQAVQAQTALLRELNDIAGLHKQRIVDETKQARELNASEQAEANRLANIRLRQG